MFRATPALVLAVFAALISLQGIGCKKNDLPSNAATADDTTTDDATAQPVSLEEKLLIAANQEFAVSLFQQLAKENQSQNLFFSPYSVSGILVVAVEGAQRETATQMGRVLRFPNEMLETGRDAEITPWNTDMINAGMATLTRRLLPKHVPHKLRDHVALLHENLAVANQHVTGFQNAGKLPEALKANEIAKKFAAELNAISSEIDQYEIRVANAVWRDKAYPLAPSYLETIRKIFDKKLVFPMDFQNQADAARKQINAWVEDQTRKRIRDLVPPDGVGSMTRLLLTNAIYFRGEWQEPFLQASTKTGSFAIAGGANVEVPMMHQSNKRDVEYAAFNSDGTLFATPKEIPAKQDLDPQSAYPDQAGFLMLELPYKGGDLSMVAIVPRNVDGLETLEKKLTNENLQNWIRKLQPRLVHVDLPKFKLEAEYAMKPTLIAMGMIRAFEAPGSLNRAQFERMSVSQKPEEQLFISEVRHKAFVEVNEKGTEAAAATSVGLTIGDDAEVVTTVPFIPTFRADRPFLFLIRDTKSGTILFLGRLVHPQE